MPPWFCLTLHARYQCSHAGACCENWAVDAEPQVMALVETRQIRRAGVSGPQFVASAPDTRGPWTVARSKAGTCIFLDQDGGHLCEIHRVAGVAALPSACRHFPRKILRDARGTLVSLSHFCPTAALMLLADDPLMIVAAGPPLRLDDPIEGLDAVHELPPLVRPGLLSDFEGYSAWERGCLEILARPDLTCGQALGLIVAATEVVREWRPGAGAMADQVAHAFHQPADCCAAAPAPDAYRLAIEPVATLSAAGIPGGLTPIDGFEALWAAHAAGPFERFDRGMKNYLAARLFATWMSYQGRGLRSTVAWLQSAAALVRHHFLTRVMAAPAHPGADDFDNFIQAVRMSDLLLLHVLDTVAFARHVAPIEGAGSK